jgi:hypothetical protein
MTPKTVAEKIDQRAVIYAGVGVGPHRIKWNYVKMPMHVRQSLDHGFEWEEPVFDDIVENHMDEVGF